MIDFSFPPPNREFQSGVVAPVNPRETWFFAFSGNMILLNFDQDGDYQPLTDATEAARLGGQQHFMGMQGEVACYAIDCENTGEFEVEGLRGVFGHISNDLLSLAGRALQICDWARTHQFCGKCGQAKRDHGKDRARVCDACGIHAYPRLSPSIIVLVHRDDEVLLARNHRFPAGMYSTLAGFVEPGESIEQTLHREVAEEVGVQLGNIEYLGSQPWPFPNSLMLGFHAEYKSGDIVCQEEEIADAQWFPVDNLPAIPGPIAISRWLIDAYLARRGIDPHA